MTTKEIFMKVTFIQIILIFTVTLYASDQQKFKNLWYDGNAEIATYSLNESRYGELRKGTRVLVFVTEPMRLATHIKPDVKLPEDKVIRVIKLNDLRKFTTGIYDYSVMTSVFTAVEKKQAFDNMATMKVSFSSQEWCGQVFDRIIRTPDTYNGTLYSYFESEGESAYQHPSANIETEDNLWIRIRELNEPMLKEGESKTIRVLPSRWIIRKSHVPSEIVSAVITKGKPEIRETVLGKINVIKFKWTINTASTTVFVEHKYPHRIVEFQERDGSSGMLMVSKREPYWKQNSNKFLNMRKVFGLD
jgi:hypothetical protein